MVPPDSHWMIVSCVLGILLQEFCFKVLGFHHLWLPFQSFPITPFFTLCSPTTPSGIASCGLALPRSLAATSGITVLFSFLKVPRCFNSSVAPQKLCIQLLSPLRVGFPIRILPVKAFWRLADTFRSLTRPSSTPDTKASSVRPYLLSL